VNIRRPQHLLLALYDRLYRFCRGLDGPASEINPALRVEIRRSRRTRRLGDGTVIGRGDRIGVLHLNNDRVTAFHRVTAFPGHGMSAMAVGLEFRRLMLASLSRLAALAVPGGPFGDVNAFVATTIFHRGLGRLGFEIDRAGAVGPLIAGAYQRALLAWLHPSALTHLGKAKYARAERLWISRTRLGALHGSSRYGASARGVA
jgi:hypothetical protein